MEEPIVVNDTPMPNLPQPINNQGIQQPLATSTRSNPPPSTVQTGKKSRTGVKNYTNEEVTTLLNLIETLKPLSETKWQEVANLYNVVHGENKKEFGHLKKKFNRLCRQK